MLYLALMADTSQGPAWWRASDGRWYPPESHPDAGNRAEATLACPLCGSPMTAGWIAMWNPIMGQKVRWQEPEPGWRRLRVPPGAEVVLQARTGGRDARIAHRCRSCSATVIPPDESYDG